MQTILREPRPIALALGEDGVAPCMAVGFHACHCSSCGALRCILRPMRWRKSEPHIPSDRRVLLDHRPTRQTDDGPVSIERPRRRSSGAPASPLGGLERNRVRVCSNQAFGFRRGSIQFPRGSNRCVCRKTSDNVVNAVRWHLRWRTSWHRTCLRSAGGKTTTGAPWIAWTDTKDTMPCTAAT